MLTTRRLRQTWSGSDNHFNQTGSSSRQTLSHHQKALHNALSWWLPLPPEGPAKCGKLILSSFILIVKVCPKQVSLKYQDCFHCWSAVLMNFSYLTHTIFGFSSTLFVTAYLMFTQWLPKQIPLLYFTMSGIFLPSPLLSGHQPLPQDGPGKSNPIITTRGPPPSLVR